MNLKSKYQKHVNQSIQHKSKDAYYYTANLYNGNSDYQNSWEDQSKAQILIQPKPHTTIRKLKPKMFHHWTSQTYQESTEKQKPRWNSTQICQIKQLIILYHMDHQNQKSSTPQQRKFKRERALKLEICSNQEKY